MAAFSGHNFLEVFWCCIDLPAVFCSSPRARMGTQEFSTMRGCFKNLIAAVTRVADEDAQSCGRLWNNRTCNYFYFVPAYLKINSWIMFIWLFVILSALELHGCHLSLYVPVGLTKQEYKQKNACTVHEPVFWYLCSTLQTTSSLLFLKSAEISTWRQVVLQESLSSNIFLLSRRVPAQLLPLTKKTWESHYLICVLLMAGGFSQL